MNPKKYLKQFAANVVQRSGIARPTVETVLPHVFDEIRYQLTEGTLCVPIDGFGTFSVIDRPEHEFLYHRGDVKEIKTVVAKKQLKFKPTKNLKREVDAGRYDPTRRAFSRHPDDPVIAVRRDMRYRPAKNYNREEGSWGKPISKAEGRRLKEEGMEDDGA